MSSQSELVLRCRVRARLTITRLRCSPLGYLNACLEHYTGHTGTVTYEYNYIAGTSSLSALLDPITSLTPSIVRCRDPRTSRQARSQPSRQTSSPILFCSPLPLSQGRQDGRCSCRSQRRHRR